MLKIKDYPSNDRARLELAIRKAICSYCSIPFLLEIERQKAFVAPVGDRVFFVHEECLNAQLRLN